MRTNRLLERMLAPELRRPVVRLGQSSQSGINEPAFLSGPSRLGPQRSMPPAPINVEAGSSSGARRTQLSDSEPGEFGLPKLFDFDLNQPPPVDYNESEGGPSNIPSMPVAMVEVLLRSLRASSSRPIGVHKLYVDYDGEYDNDEDNHDDVYDDNYVVSSLTTFDHKLERGLTNHMAQVGQQANIHHVHVAPVEPSLQTQGSPPHGPTDVVVILDCDDENEDDDNEDDVNEDDDDYDDDDDDDDDDHHHHQEEEDDVAAGDDVIISSPIAFGQASSSRTNQGRAFLIDSESLQIADNHQRNLRRRVDSQPPVNIRDNVCLEGTQSSMLQAPTPPPRRPRTYTCPICLGPMVEETTTKCGHIFCHGCIKFAMSAQGKCPICRQEITPRGLQRIYFSDPL